MADIQEEVDPQPDFEVMATNIDHASRAYATLAVHMGRMRNIPTLDHGAQILAELRALGQRFDNVEHRLEALELRFERRFEALELRFDAM